MSRAQEAYGTRDEVLGAAALEYRYHVPLNTMKTDPKTTAGRAFVRSLNILLKFARLYGYEHVRTVEQLGIAWNELRTAIPEDADEGLLLGATGTQLLLDGVPLEGSPAEKQFAQLLSAAGLASVQFTAQVSEEELAKFVHAFPTGKAKPAELAQQLKTAIADAKGIRVNEVCFVATDVRLKDASMAAQIAAASLGDEQDSFKKMLNDPQKLLELIAAAQGSHSGTGEGDGGFGGPSGGGGTGSGYGSGTGSGTGGTGSGTGYGGGTGGGWGTGAGGSGTGHGTGTGPGTGSGGGTGGSGCGTGSGQAGSGWEQERAAQARDTGRAQVQVPALEEEPAELAPEQASLAARALVGEQERAAQARDTGRAQVQVPALEEEPARAPERDRRVQSEMATRAVRLAEPRAALPAAAQAPNSSAWVVRVQEAVPEVTTAAARELAFCSAMKAAMAADADQAPEAEQAAAVVGKRATGGGGTGFGIGEPGEEGIYRILRALTTLGRMEAGENPAGAAVEFQQQVTQMPANAQEMLRNALAGIAEQGKNHKLDQSVLVQLAEHLSIRFALERFERGEVKVNAVRQMLDRMHQEVESLRKILGQHEDKMAEAGILAESHREILDRQFWASVPESAKREVLLSEEAWAIPPKNVQSYVSELIGQGNVAEAISILQNYARCADSEEPDARKRAATGLSEMAELYAQADPKLLAEALRHVGLRLSVEQDQDLQSLVSAAFVRLSQEAATQRCFPAMEQALDLLAGVETQRPGIAKTLRARMGIEERVPEFVDEALRARQISAGLTGVLKQLPQTAMEQLAVRFNRCQLRDDVENVANLAHDLGEEAVQYLRSTVRGGPVADAVEMVGLLAKLDPQATEVFLPGRVKDFPRTAQDRIVRQLSASGAQGRCRVFLAILDHVDPLVMPLVVDEIGMTGDREALGRMLTIADGDLPVNAAPFLRVKAIEALGRLDATEAVSTLKRIVETRKIFGWQYPQELRIAAMQALEKLDPAWEKEFLPKSGIERDEMSLAPLQVPLNSKFVRQRRHPRVKLQKNLHAVSTNLKQNCSLEIKTASMTGGLATMNMHLAPGTQVQLKMQLGLRNLQATALMRDYRAQDMSFEIVDMSLEERGKFRKLLLEHMERGSK